jgi:hypothetical protein
MATGAVHHHFVPNPSLAGPASRGKSLEIDHTPKLCGYLFGGPTWPF